MPTRSWLAFLLLLGSPLLTQAADTIPARKIKLPSEVDQVIRAGRGDYLLLQMNKLSKNCRV